METSTIHQADGGREEEWAECTYLQLTFHKDFVRVKNEDKTVSLMLYTHKTIHSHLSFTSNDHTLF